MELSNPIHEVAQMQVVGVVVCQPLFGSLQRLKLPGGTPKSNDLAPSLDAATEDATDDAPLAVPLA